MGCGEQRGPVSIPLPGYDKEHAADPQVGEENVHPNIRRQRVEEGKHTGVGPVGLPVQNADPQGHKGLGEVYRFFPYVGDGERSNSQVSFLCTARGETQRERERKKPLDSEHPHPSSPAPQHMELCLLPALLLGRRAAGPQAQSLDFSCAGLWGAWVQLVLVC